MLAELIFVGLSTFAYAEDSSGAGDNFEKHKAAAMEHVDKRLAALQEHKSCVTSAKDMAGMKACQAKMKDFRMDMREDHLKNKRDRIDKKLNKMQGQ